MIKATAQDLFIFGLSDANLDRLRDGKPILIDLKKMGAKEGRVLIFAGRTEEHLRDLLGPYIKPETRIHGEEH